MAVLLRLLYMCHFMRGSRGGWAFDRGLRPLPPLAMPLDDGQTVQVSEVLLIFD